MLGDAGAFQVALDELESVTRPAEPDVIVGIESRGFLFGAPLADRMGLPFVPVRKRGKLPAGKISVEYSLEYGNNHLDIHEDAMDAGHRGFIIDDLLATGGTARATAKLVKLVGGVVAGFGFLVELSELRGREALAEYSVSSIIRY